MGEKIKAIGLVGVIAGETSISTVGKDDVGLTYRGYSIEDLVVNASFEEVSHLLIHNKLPNTKELERYKKKLKEFRYLPNNLKRVLEYIPDSVHPMNVLRTGVSMLGNTESSLSKNDRDSADRILAAMPSILTYWYNYAYHGKKIEVNTDQDLIAGHFLQLLHQKQPTDVQIESMDSTLSIYGEHDFNASTFTARVITSTVSSFYSAIIGGIGALYGKLHGGANEAAMELIEKFESPDDAEEKIMQMLSNKDVIMGFGHRIYKNGDPRARIGKEWARKLASENSDELYFEVADRIEHVIMREKGLYPNVDFYNALVMYYLGIPKSMFTPIFVFGRSAGWSAHIMEQKANNSLIRPVSEYIGPQPKEFVSLADR